MKEESMSPKSVQRFWDNDMHEGRVHVAQKCAAVLGQRPASHFDADSVLFGWPIDFGLLTPYNSF
ncbi:hypothetical protein [Mesorhizobium sangaii]|uniref:Uncharacterized protein n=1 Tax=Mesorhizobium sangaii TaxID=505389 RepID=A0A841NY39_9HYPH|nr:hypothetical protein [Mesorhizobium sangaii]MBB6407984.1 hypothetical protein [Mesorhizobium sangaii]